MHFRGWIWLLVLGLTSGACETKPSKSGPPRETVAVEDKEAIRVGYQKTGTLYVVRARGTLEKRLAKLHAKVEWIDFPSGPALYEAMRGGNVDLGYVGETPPVFALAGGVPFVYVAYEPPSPGAEAILVPKESTIHSVDGLRGKKVALNRGSNVHFLLVRALDEASLDLDDIVLVFLPPADGRAAFDAGHVDAWIIWDPFFAAAEMAGARVLRNGEGLVNNRAYYVARRDFVAEQPVLLRAALAELEATAIWAKSHPKETATMYAKSTGLPIPVMIKAEKRHDYGAYPMKETIMSEQQGIADLFHALELIPKAVKMRTALPNEVITWRSESRD